MGKRIESAAAQGTTKPASTPASTKSRASKSSSDQSPPPVARLLGAGELLLNFYPAGRLISMNSHSAPFVQCM
jgi:hypothetical protein